MNESVLREYRAKPSNNTFNQVAVEYGEWLKRTANVTLQKFPTLPSATADDLVNEGLLSISKSTRRFVWFCSRCGEVFLQRRDLVEHALEEHGIRGVSELVTLGTFVECSARTAMWWQARRLVNPETPTEITDGDLGSIHTEEEFAVELLIRGAERKLSAEARVVIAKILEVDDSPLEPGDPIISELRAAFEDLIE